MFLVSECVDIARRIDVVPSLVIHNDTSAVYFRDYAVGEAAAGEWRECSSWEQVDKESSDLHWCPSRPLHHHLGRDVQASTCVHKVHSIGTIFVSNTFCRLYKSLGDYDTLRGIFSSQVGVKAITKEALAAEERTDYVEALRLYKEAVGCENWGDGQPSQVEEDLWEDSMLQVRSLLLPRN